MDLYRRSPSTNLSSCSLDEVDGTGSRGPESTSGKAHSSSALSMFDDPPPPRAPGEVAGAPHSPTQRVRWLAPLPGPGGTGNSQCGNGALHMIKADSYFFRSTKFVPVFPEQLPIYFDLIVTMDEWPSICCVLHILRLILLLEHDASHNH